MSVPEIHALNAQNFMSVFPSVLSEDETVFALARAAAEQLETAIRQTGLVSILIRIDELPEDALDILAQDFRVDWYDSNAGIEQKRRLIKTSFDVHRHKGTKAAVETAVSAIIPGSTVQEWFQYDGQPYCFRICIRIPPNGQLLSDAERTRLGQSVQYYKNARSHLDALCYALDPATVPPATIRVTPVASVPRVQNTVRTPTVTEPDIFLTHLFHVDTEGNTERLRLTYATASPPPYALDNGHLSYQYDGDEPNLKIIGGHLFFGGSLLAFGLWWALNADGTLEIYCVGDMPDYTLSESAPWRGYRGQIARVVISDGVTGVGNYAFYDYPNLTQVAISESVTSVGEGAFYSCVNLSNVTIPEGVTSIGDYAFCRCERLTGVEIPDGVTSIGGSAFYKCFRLQNITIPDSAVRIGARAFAGARFTEITLPDGMSNIAPSLFADCYGLTSVKIPDGVTSIGSDAFHDCWNLAFAVIPDSVRSIGEWAFQGCNALRDVYYSGSSSQWNAIRIDGPNSPIIALATIHYNSTGPDA